VERLVYVSTISAYANLAAPTDESAPLAELPAGVDPDVFAWEHYGALKALGERAVSDVFGEGATIVRPGYVVGGHDHTGRFSWWVHRAALGGRLPVPASIHGRAQFIDAQDLGAFLLRTAVDGLPGAYNATGPLPPVGMRDVLALSAAATGAELEVVVVPDEEVAAAGVTYPLWIHDPEWSAWAEVDVSRAIAAGLRFRPLAETVQEILAAGPLPAGVGPTAEDERRLLAR
jgi:2'-hydroxyisoflavone reductase